MNDKDRAEAATGLKPRGARPPWSPGQRRRARSSLRTSLALALAVVAAALVVGFATTQGSVEPVTTQQRVEQIASGLRCPVCQNLSVADSPSPIAASMRGEIRRRLFAGETPEEIQAYFVRRYGDWILLSPPRSGFRFLVWLAPVVALACGVLVFLGRLRVKDVPAELPPFAEPTEAERARIAAELALLEERD